MRQALRTLLIFAALAPSAFAADGRDAVAQARKKIAARDLKGAASLLEDALGTAPTADRPAVVELLKETYRGLIRDAQANGSADAAAYQDDLAILEAAAPSPPPAAAAPAPAAVPPPPEPRPAPATTPAPPEPRPAPASAPELPPTPAPAAAPTPAPASGPSGQDVIPHLGQALDRAGSPARPETPRSAPAPGTRIAPPRSFDDQVARAAAPGPAAPSAPAATRPSAPAPAAAATDTGAEPSDDELAAADALFKEGKFEQACQGYSTLAEAGKLPQARTKAWAYCRWAVVVAKINAGPKSSKDWDALDREVDDVQKLTPGSWFGDYLKDVVAEGRNGRRPLAKGAGRALRGASPDEPEAVPARSPRRPEPSTSRPLELPAATDDLPAPLPTPPVEPLPPDPSLGAASATAPAAAPSAPAPPSWQMLETPSFRIFHVDARLASQVAEAAESVRSSQGARWGNAQVSEPWSPRCDVYLYPTAAEFARMTGQPASSPGFSSMGIGDGQVVARRVNLRADHPQLVSAVLPHEVTHVVLADIFPEKQIPRWADEGMAVLSEPISEQTNRAAELDAPLAEGRIFALDQLMSIDYPDAKHWSLYYAQSVSLTQFLVSQGTPAQFVSFLKAAQSRGVDVALRDVYGIEDVTALQGRWVDHARREGSQLATAEPSASK